ncbi:MAG: VWA domain-containing protein [Promethearchaeota archaeon]
MKPPFVNISQSILKGPPQKKYSLIFKAKILPEQTDTTYPFFGIYLLDTSSSMIGDKFDSAIESLIEQINSLPHGSVFSLITFGPVCLVVDNVEINANSKTDIVEIIQNLSPEVGTPIKKALDLGIIILKKYKGPLKSKIITLMTDGYGEITAEDVISITEQILELRASMVCVGALNDHDVELLYYLAQLTLGKYIFAKTADELKQKMTIASHKSAKILFTLPSVTLFPKQGIIKMTSVFQVKPTVISLLGENAGHQATVFFRSFEAGETYEIFIKLDYEFEETFLARAISEGEVEILEFAFDFGAPNLLVQKVVSIHFLDDPNEFHLNRNLLKELNSADSIIDEIRVATEKHDTKVKVSIQGDETYFEKKQIKITDQAWST